MNQLPLNRSKNPYWRIAVVGSGPSGFYAIGELLKQEDHAVKADLFDRLPTPYGLVRGGVAPDHQKIKSVCKIFDRIATHDHFRYFGNVEFGRDVSRQDLLEHYDAVIYNVGSSSDRRLNIPGEDLQNSHSATEFVGWYNAHPDYHTREFNLDSEKAVIIGMGNVAIDVARILSHRIEELKQTDISDQALCALAASRVKDIWIIGRRGPVQAAFTPTEVRELMNLPDTEVVLEPESLDLDEESLKFLEDEASKDVRKNVELLKTIMETPSVQKKKRLHLLFLASPLEVVGNNGKVSGLKLTRNRLVVKSDHTIRAEATEQTMELETGLLFRSVGYRGEPLTDVPFDETSGTLPNKEGQLIENGKFCPKEFTAGWIKRGPSGVIGTNKPDAIQSVQRMLGCLKTQTEPPLENGEVEDLKDLLEKKGVEYISQSDWKLLEDHEIRAGEAEGRPRLKVETIHEMLEIIRHKRQS